MGNAKIVLHKMRAFCQKYFDEIPKATQHRDDTKDVRTLKKQAHLDLKRQAKWEKSKNYRVEFGGVGGVCVNVVCGEQPSTCVLNEENIVKKIAPKINWRKVFAVDPCWKDAKNPRAAKNKAWAANLYKAVQAARRTYTPLMKLDVRPRKRKQFQMESDNVIVKQTLKYHNLQNKLKAMETRSHDFLANHLNVMKKDHNKKPKPDHPWGAMVREVVDELKARQDQKKKHKEVFSTSMNQMYVLRLVGHDEAVPPGADLLKKICADLVADPNLPHDASILVRLLEQVNIDCKDKRKKWDELVVQTKESFEKQRIAEHANTRLCADLAY